LATTGAAQGIRGLHLFDIFFSLAYNSIAAKVDNFYDINTYQEGGQDEFSVFGQQPVTIWPLSR
jgi:hypothetical protein